jgi:hypothetical protein
MIAATQECNVTHVSYSEPAPLVDVMFEQLEYLVAHRSAICTPGCSECARLGQVQQWLLRPFRETGLPVCQNLQPGASLSAY